MITMTAISKSFPGVRALDGVDFNVEKGEVHALLGENGSGKSTLTKIMAGVYHPDSGAMSYEGRAVRWSSPREARAAWPSSIFRIAWRRSSR